MSTTTHPAPRPALTDRDARPRRAAVVQLLAITGTATPILAVVLWALTSQL